MKYIHIKMDMLAYIFVQLATGFMQKDNDYLI